MTKKKIVIVEDEPDILDVLCYNLRREGFDVDSALDGSVGLTLIQKVLPDLVLLDLMLPGMDGLDICQNLKRHTQTQTIPVIMLSAKGEESDVVLGLGIGADDYIAKPFSPKELIARVKAVIRRSEIKVQQPSNELLEVGGLCIDAHKHKLTRDNIEIKLTATEFRLLLQLASNPGRVYSREQLLDLAFSNDVVVVDRNIDVHIRSIRKKINSDQVFIETVRGVGYRFTDGE